MFVDVVGFSTLSERLAAAGTRGTERLTDELNGFFDPSIEVIHAAGGDVLAFGGDSMFVSFGELADTATLQSVASQIHAIAARRRISIDGDEVAIVVRIGISNGDVISTVARAGQRVVPVHGGGGIDGAVDAHRGIDAGTTGWRENALDLADADAGKDSVRGARSGNPVLPTAPGSGPEATGRTLLHPVIANRLEAGAGFVAEHRLVTCAFYCLDDADWSTPAGVDHIAATVEDSLAIIGDLGGEMTQFVSGDKGSFMLAVFGAPIAIPDPGAAAIGAAHRIRAECAPLLRAGIASGPCFMLLLGGRERQSYTVLGDTPNLAARLLGLAPPRTTMCDGRTVAITGGRCSVDSTETVVVKGRVTPVQAAIVRPTSGPNQLEFDRVAADSPMVGRVHERDRLDDLLIRVNAGIGGSALVRGDPGMGKSRLMRETLARSPSAVRVIVVGGERLTTARSYSSWTRALGSLLDHAPDPFTAAVELLPRAAPLLPLLGAALGTDALDNAMTEHLVASERSELTARLLADLVLARAAHGPIAVVVEDCHWLDQASAELVWTLVNEGPAVGLGVIVFTRPELVVPPVVGFGESLSLAPLGLEESTMLAADAWSRAGGEAPNEDVSAALAQRSGGNPLFVESLVDATRSDPDGITLALPADLTNLLASRLDNLPEAAQLVLRYAAIYESSFTVDDIARCFESALASVGAAPAESIELGAETLLAAGLLQRSVIDGAALMSFRHATVYDVAYGTISHAERRDLHGSVAKYLRAKAVAPITVASHALRSEDQQIELAVLPEAASEASRTWQVELASAFYERLVAIGDEAVAVDAAVELARLDLITGRHDRMESLLLRPAADATQHARQRLVLAEWEFTTGRLSQADNDAREVLETPDLDDHDVQAAREMLVRIMAEQGDYASAIELASDMLDLARQRHDVSTQIAALASLGVSRALSGQPAEARREYEEARALALEVGDTLRYVHVTSDLHFVALSDGDGDRARSLLMAARVAATELGYVRHLAISVANEANLELLVGDLEVASRLGLEATERLVGLGDLPSAMNAVDTVLQAMLPAVDPTTMAALASRAADVERALGRVQAEAEMVALAAECSQRLGNDGQRPESVDGVDQLRNLLDTIVELVETM